MDTTLGIGAPVLYDHYNAYNAMVQPSTQHSQNTGLTRFFERYLLQRAISVYKWKMPETWERNYALYCLYCWGFFAVINTDKFGVIPQGCSLKGYGVQYQPTQCVIANPLLSGLKEPYINKDCVLIRLQPDYGGIWDLVSFYADMMSMTAQTAGINIENSKLAYIFMANNKALSASFKKLYDNVTSGEPAVVADKRLFNIDGKPLWGTFANSLKENYIAGSLLTDLRNWEKRFDAEIGIPTTNTEKKERLVESEVNSNALESATRAEMWLDELKLGCDRARKMFGIDLTVEWRINPREEIGNATRDINSNGTV